MLFIVLTGLIVCFMYLSTKFWNAKEKQKIELIRFVKTIQETEKLSKKAEKMIFELLTMLKYL